MPLMITMAWVGDNYFYSIRILKEIAKCYYTIYQGLEFKDKRGWLIRIERHPLRLAEYRADFGIALRSIGKKEKDIERLTFNNFVEMCSFLNGGVKECLL